MYGYNPQMNIDRLQKQRDEIDTLIKSYQNIPQQPVNNIINTTNTQIPSENFIEWRILNENEEVDNLFVKNKTLFVGDKNMVLKGVDGKLEKWNIEKTYPVDEKDLKIKDLEKQISELKGMINNGYSKCDKPINECKESVKHDDEYVKSKSKNDSK